MIQRMSDANKIKFLGLDDEESSEKSKKSEKISKKTLNQICEEQKSKKLTHKDNGMMTSQHISSARTGEITDMGGPSFKNENSNTIWENDKLAHIGIDNKTKTIQEKEEIATNRREAEQKRMDSLTEVLRTTDQNKASTILLNGTQEGTNYKINHNNMSMFDEKDFQRLDEKTGGEKISEDVKNKNNQKDESWRNGGKIVTSKDLMNKVVDSLFGDKE